MNTLNIISKRLNNITQENLLNTKRVLPLNTSNTAIWKGTKRYAH